MLLASSLDTLGEITTLSPGFQLAGVAILCLHALCRESSTLTTSSMLRPGARRDVAAGGILLVGVDHVELLDDVAVWVRRDGIGDLGAFVVGLDVLDPRVVGLHVITRQP
ncbi:Na(+)/H(+) antiporter NhaA [Striga asiatica]|uniref:Na(+)/H(+) antiporter NhaA n=1 Tax=Striga asiatica TaxID=4170 RepID=A0A5A7R353_STRAF|nr:Na(+)/H(+) antiporter NhaA [Striga asiatica]